MLINIDGFDAYGTSQLPLRWYLTGSAASYSVQPTAGRNGLGCLKIDNLYSGNSITRPVPNLSYACVGMAFKFSVMPSTYKTATCESPIFSLRRLGKDQLVVSTDPIGNLILFSGTARLASFAANLQPNTWYYLELKATIGTSVAAGSCSVYLNSAPVIQVAGGVNTSQGDPSGVVDSVRVGSYYLSGWSSSSALFVDDLYILDGSGSANISPLGDVRIESIKPNAAGATSQFTPVGAGANWDCVNDANSDGDATYVSSATPGAIDVYGFQDIASSAETIYGLQFTFIAKKSDTAPRKIRTCILDENLEPQMHADSHLLSTDYLLFSDIWEAHPDGQWTEERINGLQAGIELEQ